MRRLLPPPPKNENVRTFVVYPKRRFVCVIHSTKMTMIYASSIAAAGAAAAATLNSHRADIYAQMGFGFKWNEDRYMYMENKLCNVGECGPSSVVRLPYNEIGKRRI